MLLPSPCRCEVAGRIQDRWRTVQPLLSACDLDEKEFDLLVQVASNLGWLAAYRKLRASEAVALGDSRFDDFQLPVGQHRNSSCGSREFTGARASSWHPRRKFRFTQDDGPLHYVLHSQMFPRQL